MAQRDYDQVSLTINLEGRAPDQRTLKAYDLGVILTATQRMVGTIGSFELSRQETRYSPLSRFMDTQLVFARESSVQCNVQDLSYGSFKVEFVLTLWEELQREFANGELGVSFLNSVLANYFTSILTASGKMLKDRIWPERYNLPSHQKEDLTHRALPSLITLVSKLDRHSGISQMNFSGHTSREKFEWNLEINRDDSKKIQSFADQIIAPTGEYRGYLRGLDLDRRTGTFVDAYSQERFDLAIPRISLCEKLAGYLNQQVVLVAYLITKRNIDDRRIRTSMVVQDIIYP